MSQTRERWERIVASGGDRPGIDLVEESFVVAQPARVAERLRDPALWRRSWPDLDLAVFQDRGDEGLRWTVAGALVGSMEVWLEPHGDGVIVHHYLRAEPTRGRTSRATRREARRRSAHARRLHWALKDDLEAGRAPGSPRSAVE